MMRIERGSYLRSAALAALTILILAGTISGAGATPSPRLDLPSVASAERQGDQPQQTDREEGAEAASAIYERVAPAVVLIHAVSINPYRSTERVRYSVGSGFIIDPEGLVLTNSHVAFGSQSLVVKLNDGASLPAQLIGADPIFDIAVLRIPRSSRTTKAIAASRFQSSAWSRSSAGCSRRPNRPAAQSDIVITVTPHIIRPAEIKPEDHLARFSGTQSSGLSMSIEDVVFRAQAEEEQERRLISRQPSTP